MEYDDPVSWNNESFVRYHCVYHLTYVILDIIARREVSFCYKDSTSIPIKFNVIEAVLDLVSLKCLFYNLLKSLHYIQLSCHFFQLFFIFLKNYKFEK